ncbi:MAG: response regulator transcription factor [Stenomitos rutilans HA7619-LM2]|jgi:DNA-binding NarL/FixJ family response regulator|nr:response regulator transcription factor [Stenomitos rutilans HA7619-LM2]
MIRVLIVDDQTIVCEGLKVVLNAAATIETIGTAQNGEQAVSLVKSLQPDLVLMDLKMPVVDGVSATRAIKAQHPHLPILILTTYDQDEWVVDAIRAGASGYLLKDTNSEDIIAAIEGTIAGKTHIDPLVAGKLFNVVRHGAPPSVTFVELLTQRERQVLSLLASGLTNAAIADRLNLSEGTIRNHVTSILAKLEVSDRAQATAIAWRYGLVGMDFDSVN